MGIPFLAPFDSKAPTTDFEMLYCTTLSAKQELDAQHKLLGDEVKRLKVEKAQLLAVLERAVAEAVADDLDDWFAAARAIIDDVKGNRP